MAITGISAISGEQIIAAGAVSAREAASAAFTTGGNSLQGLYDTVSNNSGSWTGGQASLPITAMSGNYSADYDVSQVVINYEENQGEPTHYRTTVGADGLSLYNSSNEDETNSIVYITPEYIDFKTTDDQHASIDPYTINDWNSTYNTVYDNSANWGGGSTYTGDAQGALDEVYTNSGTWNSTYTTVSSNSATWGGSALPISAGPGIKLEMVNNTLVASTDETLLWSGAMAGTILSAETTLTESMKNFERIRFYFGSDYNQGQVIEQNCPVGSNNYFNFALPGGGANCWMQYSKWSADDDFIKIKMQYCKAINYGSFTGTGSITLTATTANDLSMVQKIVGINRIAGV